MLPQYSHFKKRSTTITSLRKRAALERSTRTLTAGQIRRLLARAHHRPRPIRYVSSVRRSAWTCVRCVATAMWSYMVLRHFVRVYSSPRSGDPESQQTQSFRRMCCDRGSMCIYIYICRSNDRNSAREGNIVAVKLFDVDEIRRTPKAKEEKKRKRSGERGLQPQGRRMTRKKTTLR